jgi:hypothetical protein
VGSWTRFFGQNGSNAVKNEKGKTAAELKNPLNFKHQDNSEMSQESGSFDIPSRLIFSSSMRKRSDGSDGWPPRWRRNGSIIEEEVKFRRLSSGRAHQHARTEPFLGNCEGKMRREKPQ